jgi:hypothetical protein
MSADFDSQEPVQNRDPGGEREIVDLQFNTLREFRQEMAPRLAENGMFVSTDTPLARGTRVRFRFLLPEKFVLAQGDATVAWRRTKSTHPDVEPGMALWFDEIEKRSLDIIQELVDIQKTSGEQVFDSRRGAGEVGNFVANEFAGSFVPAANIPNRGTVPQAEATGIDHREPAPSAGAHDAPQGLSSDTGRSYDVASETGPTSSSEAMAGFSAPEPAVGGAESFEVSLMADDSEPDETPLSEGAGPIPDLSVVMQDSKETPRRRSLWPLAGLAVVALAVAAAAVWWFAFRSQDQLTQEVYQPAEVIPTATAAVSPDDSEGEEVPGQTATGTSLASGSSGADSGPIAEPSNVVEEQPRTSVPPPVQPQAATRVIDVAAVRSTNSTVVSIRGNGDFEDSRLRVSFLPEPPRVLARIADIETYYRPSEIEVGSPELARIRVGYHPEDNPPRLYVVLDLADDSVVVRESSVAGEMIRIVVGHE